MKISQIVIQTAIKSFVTVIGQKNVFDRVKNQVAVIDKDLSGSEGKVKRAKFFEVARILFVDVIEPIAESMLRMLLELAVAYIKSGAK